jgi:S-DNA-T family DNA segregation ATPase FtsK/SpoIIIE
MLDQFSASPDKSKAAEQSQVIEQSLADFGVEARVRNVHFSPRLTQFSLKLGSTTEVSHIEKLEQDLAVALAGNLVKIEGPDAGYPYLRLIVKNRQDSSVKLHRILASSTFGRFQGQLKVGLGLDTFGAPVIIDLAELPHLLIGGTTGSGKSVCLNAMVASLLCTYAPNMVRLLLIDPNYVELEKYNGLPHLLVPVVTRTEAVLPVLEQVLQEIERRYSRFSQLQVRDLAAYNHQARQTGRDPLPYLVIFVDNLFDLMIDAPGEIDRALTRIAQKARAAGIHMVLATLRSTVATISGSIKANFPGRIAFKVTDSAESRLILDVSGAENLLGEGDMLYKSPQTHQVQRVQGNYVSERELLRLIHFWRSV